jgi:hypothetical protein
MIYGRPGHLAVVFPPPSPVKARQRHAGRLIEEVNLLTGEGEEPNHTTARQPGPL